MSTFTTQEVLHQLQTGLEAAGDRVAALESLPLHVLIQQPPDGGWSVVQILEHLNFYSRFYDDRFKTVLQIAHRKGLNPHQRYRSGWLGDYFVKLMAPKPDGSVATKMKAPAVSVPASRTDAGPVLAEFRLLQHALLQRVSEAGAVRLDGVRVPTMLPLISLRLGDAFRFLLAHQERHLAQAGRTLKAVRKG